MYMYTCNCQTYNVTSFCIHVVTSQIYVFNLFIIGYEKYFLEAAAEGTYPVKWTNIAMYGPAKVGKTSLVGLFLNRLPQYPDEDLTGLPHDDVPGEDDTGYGSEVENVDACTEVRLEELENKEEMYEYRYYYRKNDPKYVWKTYDIDSLYLKLAEIIKNFIENPPDDSYLSWSGNKELRTKFPPPPPPPKYVVPEDSVENIIQLSAKSVLELLPITANLNGIEKAHWVYVHDCAGETLFVEIAPMMMHYYCINLCCHKVIEPLEKPVEFAYSVEGRKVYGRPLCPMSNQKLIREVFAGKEMVNHPRAIGILTQEFASKPYFAMVATYYDMYQALEKESKVKEPINDKNDLLQEELKDYAHVRVDMNTVNGQVCFPFNASARQKKDLKNVERVKRIANHCFVENVMPIRWYLFFLQINEIKGSSRVMVTVTECVKMAGYVGIHSVEVVRAILEYFHDLMFIFYYPEALPNVIFLSQKRIFDKISEIIAVKLGEHTGMFDPNHIALLEKGVLHRNFLNDLNYGFLPNLFTPDGFLKLLVQLFIIAPLPDNKYMYYLPFLLPTVPYPHKDIPTDRLDPLLLFWKRATVPIPTGLFNTLVMYLLNKDSKEFRLGSLDENYKNKLVLDWPAIEGKLILFQCYEFMGITHTGPLIYSPTVRDTVLKGIEDVCDILHWKDEQRAVQEGFLCRMDTCDIEGPHICFIDLERDFLSCQEEVRPQPRVMIQDFTQLPWYQPIGMFLVSLTV